MVKFIYLFLITVASTLVLAKPITITGKAKNMEQGKVLLFVYDGSELDYVDSANVKKGIFVFKNKEIPRGLYKLGISANEAADVILGKENLAVEFDKTSFLTTFKVVNSPENDGLSKYSKANAAFATSMQDIETKAQALYQLKYSDQQKFETEITKLQKKVDSLTNKLYGKYNEVGQNNTLFIAKYSKALMQKDTTPRQKLFPLTELNDAELCRSNLFAIKTQMYFQRYTKPEVNDYQIAADEVMANLPAKSKAKEQVYKTMLGMFSNANLDYYGTILRTFKEEYKDNKEVQDYIKRQPKKDFFEGDEVPDIALADTSGKVLPLSSFRGKVVLVDFWASWCGPCRMENPNVVRVFQKYKDKGFTVFGVSLDQNKEKWIGAIKQDRLTWNHVSDLKGWSSDGAKLYGVKSIPQTYLIDAEGRIIAKNLRGEMLEQKLKEIFKE